MREKTMMMTLDRLCPVQVGNGSGVLLTSLDDLTAIAQDWAQLWKETPGASIFQHPSWILCWWEVFGSDKALFCPVILNPASERGIASVIPLCILRDEENTRKLMFIGAGLSDSMDVLVSEGHCQLACDFLFNTLARHWREWDTCDLQPLPAYSPLCDHARKSLQGRCAIFPEEHHLFLALPDTFPEFEARFSPHFRERIRDAWRKGESIGEIRFEQVPPGEIPETVQALFRFRRERWKHMLGLTPDAEEEKAELFFSNVSWKMLSHGLLRLYRLEIAGQIAAVLMGFIHRKKAGFYLIGFDRAFSKASPGTLVLWNAIKKLIEEGATECDFLRGEESYKQRWGGELSSYFSLRIKAEDLV